MSALVRGVNLFWGHHLQIALQTVNTQHSGATVFVYHVGELEIADVNCIYLVKGALQVQTLGRGFAWLVAGTHGSLLKVGQFIATIEKRQGLKIACLEEIAWWAKWIDNTQIENMSAPLHKTGYGQSILMRLQEKT